MLSRLGSSLFLKLQLKELRNTTWLQVNDPRRKKGEKPRLLALQLWISLQPEWLSWIPLQPEWLSWLQPGWLS